MKPKGAYQKMIVELSANLPKITDEQKEWGYKKCLDYHVLYLKKALHCTECGHSWSGDKPTGKVICPSCNKSLRLLEDYKSPQRVLDYFAILDVVNGIQLVRTICTFKVIRNRKVLRWFSTEVMQHWIREDGNVTTMSLNVHGYTLCFDLWRYDTDMEIREAYTDRAHSRTNLSPSAIYPSRKILPILKRNGFKGYFYGIQPKNLFHDILTKSHSETLLKAGQIPMLKSYMQSSYIDKYWPSVKICIRNKYLIEDTRLWKDHIDSLVSFNKDILNSKYVCPKDLIKDHNRLVQKRKNIEKKQKLVDLEKKLAFNQIEYVNAKSKFFGLKFQRDNIEIAIIESVSEFMKHGVDLEHCVYTNQYFKKNDSLIFTAAVDSKPVEAIEFSLVEKKVVQARGMGNKASRYHTKILNLMNKNIHQITNRMSV